MSKRFSLEMGLSCMKGEFLHVGDPEKAAKNLGSLFDSSMEAKSKLLWRCLAVRNLKTEHNDDNWHYPVVTGRSCPLKMWQKLG